MTKILIITTDGCEACEIAKHNVGMAVLQSHKVDKVETKNWKDCPKEFIVKNKIKDFPAVIYLINDVVVNKTLGTYPSAVYLRWIDMYFK